MNLNYEKIQQSINEYGQYILNCIKNQYSFSMTHEQLKNIDDLLGTEFIVIEKPTKEDVEFFSKQAGITNPKYYSSEYIPSAHGGRTKEDNKIHIYPYTKSFSDCKNEEEILKLCIDNIIIHEIFHYFIRPNLNDERDKMKTEFGHFITEGLVQYYAEQFAQKYRLGNPKSNYYKNVEFVKKLIASFPNTLTQVQVDKIIFTYNQDELLNMAHNGNLMYQEYIDEFQFKKEVSSLITIIGRDIGLNKEDKELKGIIKHYKKIDDINLIYAELSQNIEQIFKADIKKKESYTLKLKNLISDKKLKKEMTRYSSEMKKFLPIEEQAKKLKRSGKKIAEIKEILGSDSYIFENVPAVLYHGSPKNLDIINSNESTQKGSYVYATDNPIHALFFSIFRNSSIARAHIDEYIDKNGNYQVKYYIDERVQGALDEIISNQNITIHVCNGEQFFKPQGEAYIGREWISKDGQSIVPIDKIQVNVKHFFEILEKEGLVEYDKYDKSKNWKTIIDMLGQNYPFGLGTDRGKNIDEFDLMYDEFIEKNFPEQLEFSKQFRNFIKDIMATDYKLENPIMTSEEEANYKLRTIKKIADSFLLAEKDKTGKIKWSIDIEKINTFMAQTDTLQEEIKRSL